MKELSLHILDVAQNSLSAGAAWLELSLVFRGEELILTIRDDGHGMEPEFLAAVLDPFTTSRTTRSVGLGLPLLKLTAEQTGGEMTVDSTVGVGTSVRAVFHTSHIDCPPLGDLASTLALLIQGAPEVTYCFTYDVDGRVLRMDTRELRDVLGDDVSLAEPEIILWLTDYIAEGLAEIGGPGEME